MKHYLCQFFRRHFGSLAALADPVVLAEAAGKVAVGDKDGARTTVPDERGLLAKVRPVTGNHRQEPGPAEAPFFPGPAGTAPAGADPAGPQKIVRLECPL